MVVVGVLPYITGHNWQEAKPRSTKWVGLEPGPGATLSVSANNRVILSYKRCSARYETDGELKVKEL